MDKSVVTISATMVFGIVSGLFVQFPFNVFMFFGLVGVLWFVFVIKPRRNHARKTDYSCTVCEMVHTKEKCPRCGSFMTRPRFHDL